jgi:hypothetical protein
MRDGARRAWQCGATRLAGRCAATTSGGAARVTHHQRALLLPSCCHRAAAKHTTGAARAAPCCLQRNPLSPSLAPQPRFSRRHAWLLPLLQRAARRGGASAARTWLAGGAMQAVATPPAAWPGLSGGALVALRRESRRTVCSAHACCAGRHGPQTSRCLPPRAPARAEQSRRRRPQTGVFGATSPRSVGVELRGSCARPAAAAAPLLPALTSAEGVTRAFGQSAAIALLRLRRLRRCARQRSP